MGEGPLTNQPTQAGLLASVNALYGAVRGVFVPRNAAGEVRAGAASLGNSTYPWDEVHAQALVIGGSAVNVAAFAAASPSFVFAADEPAFAWPSAAARCLAIVASGVGGGQSSGSGNQSFGANGGASTVTVGGVTLTSGAGPGGGRTGAVFPIQQSTGWTTHAAAGSSVRAAGRQNVRARIFAGLSLGQTMAVAIGSGGAGASFGSPGADGDDGFAILYAIA